MWKRLRTRILTAAFAKEKRVNIYMFNRREQVHNLWHGHTMDALKRMNKGGGPIWT